MYSEMTGLRRSVYRRTAMHFCIFYLMIMLFTTVILAMSHRGELIQTLKLNWSDVSHQVGAVVDGKSPDQLTVEDQVELSGILADFCGRQSYRNAYPDAVLCWSDGTKLHPVARAGFGTISFSDPEDGTDKYLFLDDDMGLLELSDLLSHARTAGPGGRWNNTGTVNSVWGYADGNRVIPQRLEIDWVGSVESWRKDFQPEHVDGLKLREYRDVVFHMPNLHWVEYYDEAQPYQKGREKLNRFLQFSPPDTSFEALSLSGVAKPYYADGYRDGDGYRLLYATDYHPVWLAVRQMLYVYLIGLIAAGFLMRVLSSELSRFVTRPVEGLNRAALEMASGKRDVEYRVEKGRDDEIAELANSLNVMSHHLQGEYDRQVEREKQRRELTNAIAHELKTPLGIIHGYCESLQENIHEEKRAHYLAVILDETERMNALILEMLDLSRMESESFRLRMEPFFLDELAQEAAERYRSAAEEKEVQISLQTEPDCEITADRGRIAQALSNFLSNAIRHTPEGGIISVRVLHAGHAVRCEVENEGAPIPEEQQERIWDVFYKADASRQRAKGGTGLGLAIARHILELHGMAYGVRNTGTGVLFWFELKQA
ncbi:HAMP domain-containing sensor histidine kinase [Clostridium sp. D33t1_170424_F3]|uniref:sensor histidine kinase n=1 Tax=Clostridium sp. D33t1_170424_F3 TaxID=2787099 RepID=UPI0018AAEDF1|nr:HAMP domain-containing sensor histidine kinase [Clostridium sp. D33t1_170424_F3]